MAKEGAMIAWRGCTVLIALTLLLAGGSALGFHLTEMAGPVMVERDGMEIAAGEDALRPGDRLRIGESGYAVLTDRSGQAMVLAGGSTMVLSSDLPGAAAYRIEQGLARIVATSPATLTVPYARIMATNADLLAYVVRDVASVFVLSGTAVAEDASGRKVELASGHRLVATGTLFESRSFDPESLGPFIDQKQALIRHLVLDGTGIRAGGSPSEAGRMTGPVRGPEPEPSTPGNGQTGPNGPGGTGEQPQGVKDPDSSQGSGGERGTADKGKDSDDAGEQRGGERADKGGGDDGPQGDKASSSGKGDDKESGKGKAGGFGAGGGSKEQGRDSGGDPGRGTAGRDNGSGSEKGRDRDGGTDAGGKGTGGGSKGGGKGADRGGEKGGDKGGGKGSDKGGGKGGGRGSDKGGGKGDGKSGGGKGGKR
jgi:hypothetical protein